MDSNAPVTKSDFHEAGKAGSYTYIEDNCAEGAFYSTWTKTSTNIISVKENVIPQIVNLSVNGSREYDVNYVKTFEVSKGEVKTETIKTFLVDQEKLNFVR